jgi:MFS family permease
MARVLEAARLDAPLGFGRWSIVLGALAIDLSIGQAYAFSVFNLPLTRVLGVTAPLPGDWTLSQLGWTFTLAYVFLGLSAGLAGGWQDRVGPRRSGMLAAVCFGGGFFVAAAGVHWHQLGLVYLGYGVLCGCGLGLGFNTPIAPLLRWFPDRPGLATGLAIMGFGGGAIIAAPVSTFLIETFAAPRSVGVAETFVVLGSCYGGAMLLGARALRLPPSDWRPRATSQQQQRAGLTLEQALRTRQFYLLWLVLLLNVTAGLGLLGQAAAIVQEMFDGVSAATAAWFVAALSFFNMAGRLIWAALSDRLGRKDTYTVFFLLGPLLYAMLPWLGEQHRLAWFVACFALIMTMYGGGFAAMPAYIADLFGSEHVSAIHGRVLTALSVAGVVGPALVNYLRERWIAEGYSASHAYDGTLYIMAGLLVVGFVCNRAIDAVSEAAPAASLAEAALGSEERPS